MRDVVFVTSFFLFPEDRTESCQVCLKFDVDPPTSRTNYISKMGNNPSAVGSEHRFHPHHQPVHGGGRVRDAGGGRVRMLGNFGVIDEEASEASEDTGPLDISEEHNYANLAEQQAALHGRYSHTTVKSRFNERLRIRSHVPYIRTF